MTLELSHRHGVPAEWIAFDALMSADGNATTLSADSSVCKWTDLTHVLFCFTMILAVSSFFYCFGYGSLVEAEVGTATAMAARTHRRDGSITV